MTTQTSQQPQHFWRQVLSLALPVAAQGLLYALLGIVNQLMVGQLGEQTVVAVALGAKIQSVMYFAQMGMTAGLGILAAQHVGQKTRDKIAPLQGVMLATTVLMSLVFMVISCGFPHFAMSLFTADPRVIAIGSGYQRLLSLSYLPTVILGVYTVTLRSDGIVKMPLYLSLAAVPLEMLLNFGFIFGHWGFPRLGAMGAGLSTTLSITLEVLLLLIVVYRKKLTGSFSIRQMRAFHWRDAEIVKLWKLTMPLLGDNLSFILSASVISSIYGFMGTTQTAAVTIMQPVENLLITFFGGFATAASVMVGHRLGRNAMSEAYRTGKRLIGLSIIAPLAIALLLLIPMPWYLNFYHLSAESLSLTKAIMVVMALFVPSKIVNMVLGSILGAGGETKFIFYLSILGGWILAVPIGLLTAFFLHLDIVWVFAAVTAEEVVRALLGGWKMHGKSWLTNLVSGD